MRVFGHPLDERSWILQKNALVSAEILNHLLSREMASSRRTGSGKEFFSFCPQPVSELKQRSNQKIDCYLKDFFSMKRCYLMVRFVAKSFFYLKNSSLKPVGID